MGLLLLRRVSSGGQACHVQYPYSGKLFSGAVSARQYWSEEAVPAYMKRENLPLVKERLDRLEIVTADAQSCGRQPSLRSMLQSFEYL